ncbi:hypothetical protein M406DRAFT_275913 [Cryphonectria parasitica EP155]|uniref:Uncharacterized protein n=1 Tax=Cryphonectria parasitica (strain ATCC 38755 / EP155) TaxID=660469 RepID=A0A9P5CR28_CRYP1|nr:uncharacterized protein M406DRAFT_275913 [Cryphonectria parasitica EP155]KAF3768124.1 hypothetical protein M406DRAFT_275913 [Cryphonectria parasitica EP155]
MRHVNSIPYHPCIRADLLDLRLHRQGPTIRNDLQPWFQEKQRLLLEANEKPSTHLLFLTQGFGEAFEDALSVHVSRFQKKPGDRTAYYWTDWSGRPRSMEMPPYFISDLEEARKNLFDFTRNVRSVYIETITADSNSIIRKTFQAALHFGAYSNANLVSDALDIWVAARLIETQFRVFNGGFMAGMKNIDEAGHPFDGFIPVTPMMDSQLDDLVIRDLIRPLCARFLARLKGKIEERKRENWMEIYLAMFIMMSNMSLILKDMAGQAKWKGLKPGNRGGTLTQGFMHACKTLLAYFHHACAGAVPITSIFTESQNAANAPYYGMEPDQIEYLCNIRQEIFRQGEKLANWNSMSMYDDELYWCYQLLVKDWRGDIPYLAGEIDDFREEDFLSSSTT